MKKPLWVVGVGLFLLIPLLFLQALVQERVQSRDSAYAQVAQGWGGAQAVSGPVLAIPVTTRDTTERVVMRTWYVLPESLDMQSDIVVQKEKRSVGIYEVPVYVARLQATAEFDVARQVERLLESDPTVVVHKDSARLIVPVDDPRGLREVVVTHSDWPVKELEPTTGFSMPALATPVRGDVGLPGRHKIAVTMEIAGTHSFSVLPLARSTHVSMKGNWPHPGFARGFLPTERTVTDDRFTARWQLLDINRSYGGTWFEQEVSGDVLRGSSFGVNFFQPVDLYQRVMRAVKYGMLFISLSLLTLFIWEQIARRRLHPMHYGLTGLALAVFYLLLLAFSEHIGFAAAYVVAAIALCALLGVYLGGAFQSTRSGIGASGLFAALYAVLYLLVTSEDYALLAGALALFGVLTTAMLLTRKLNWYAVADDERG